MFNITLSSWFGSSGRHIAHILHINVVTNWQLLNRPEQYHLTVSRAQVPTHWSRVSFWSYPLTSYQFSNDCRLKFNFFNSYEICCVYMCRTVKILISNWPRKLKFSQFSQAGKTCQLLLTFLTKVTIWSHSTSNFYAVLGQNWTGEFMRKIYAASWNLFTLTAEADRVLCQLVMFLTVFFHWMYKMKFNCYQESSVSLFIGFLVEKYVACQSRKSDFGWHRFRFSPCLMRKRVEKSEAILALLDSSQCIPNSKPE